jgi:hypothetical protein
MIAPPSSLAAPIPRRRAHFSKKARPSRISGWPYFGKRDFSADAERTTERFALTIAKRALSFATKYQRYHHGIGSSSSPIWKMASIFALRFHPAYA